MSWTFELTDIVSDQTIVDVTQYTLNGKISPRLNRPLAVTLDMPSDQSALQAIQSDGDPALWPGTRAIKAYQDGELRGHTAIQTLSYSGGVDHDSRVQVAGLDPLSRLPSRQVFDATGNLADPSFPPPIDAGAMIVQAIENGKLYDDNILVDPVTSLAVTPAIFPIDTTLGEFTTTANMGEYFAEGPQTIGDLVTALTDTGTVDVYLRPVDSSTPPGYLTGEMAQLNVVPQWGTDRTATVHFDYATGSKNVQAARRLLDLSTLASKLTYELGPKDGKDRWKGNIDPSDVGDLGTSYLHQSLIARKKYGVYHQLRVYDTDNDNASRPLYIALFKMELTLRRRPRDLLYLQPVAAGSGITPTFRPFIDYDIGDIVAVNASAVLGKPFSAAAQRIYGYDVEIDVNGVERVSELITSADAE